MTGSPPRREGVGLVGAGAAACVACCASPVLAILGGVTVAGVAGTVVFGVAATLVAVLAVALIAVLRRRRRMACDVEADVPVLLTPTRSREPLTAGGTR
jgi:hypothetical protein